MGYCLRHFFLRPQVGFPVLLGYYDGMILKHSSPALVVNDCPLLLMEGVRPFVLLRLNRVSKRRLLYPFSVPNYWFPKTMDTVVSNNCQPLALRTRFWNALIFYLLAAASLEEQQNDLFLQCSSQVHLVQVSIEDCFLTFLSLRVGDVVLTDKLTHQGDYLP